MNLRGLQPSSGHAVQEMVSKHVECQLPFLEFPDLVQLNCNQNKPGGMYSYQLVKVVNHMPLKLTLLIIDKKINSCLHVDILCFCLTFLRGFKNIGGIFTLFLLRFPWEPWEQRDKFNSFLKLLHSCYIFVSASDEVSNG